MGEWTSCVKRKSGGATVTRCRVYISSRCDCAVTSAPESIRYRLPSHSTHARQQSDRESIEQTSPLKHTLEGHNYRQTRRGASSARANAIEQPSLFFPTTVPCRLSQSTRTNETLDDLMRHLPVYPYSRIFACVYTL